MRTSAVRAASALLASPNARFSLSKMPKFALRPRPSYHSSMAAQWFVYVVRCRDGSLYTGITTDVERRLAEHDAGSGARYTRGRGPVELVATVGPMTRSDALRLEVQVKRAPTPKKVAVLQAGLPAPDAPPAG